MAEARTPSGAATRHTDSAEDRERGEMAMYVEMERNSSRRGLRSDPASSAQWKQIGRVNRFKSVAPVRRQFLKRKNHFIRAAKWEREIYHLVLSLIEGASFWLLLVFSTCRPMSTG